MVRGLRYQGIRRFSPLFEIITGQGQGRGRVPLAGLWKNIYFREDRDGKPLWTDTCEYALLDEDYLDE